MEFSNVWFTIMGTESRVRLIDFISEHLKSTPKPEIYIGTDSQNRADKTIFVSAVLLRYPKNGARVIYAKQKVERIKDLWSRLWFELEQSIALAHSIEAGLGIKIKQIDMDYNSNEGFQSHKVYKAAKGYVESLGYTSKAKPEELMATWAANSLCN